MVALTPAAVGAAQRNPHPNRLPVAATRQQSRLPSESFVLYVNRHSPLGNVYAAEDDDLIDWPVALKRQVDRSLMQLQKQAPGLIARACNGEKIHLVLGTVDNDEAMDTTSARIKVNRPILRCGDVFVRETLAHELVHYVDCGNAISSTPQWNQLISQALLDYRKKFPDSAMLSDDRQFARAQKALK
jgi:hypothetical protein